MTPVRVAVVLDSAGDGARPPLVLLHGVPVDHRMWDPLVAALPARVGVVLVDLPGLGAATLEHDARPTEPSGQQTAPSLEAAADAVAAALRGSGHRRVVVAGLSMGGYVALALAERHPDLVAGLGLLDTRSTPDAEAARANRLRVADAVETAGDVEQVRGMITAVLGATTLRSRPHLVEVMDGWIQEQRPDGVAWSQRAMAARPDRTDVLRGFSGPVTVVVGAQDTVTPIEEAEHMVQAVAHGCLVVVPEAGHMSALESPVAVAATLVALVDAVPSAG